MGWINMLHLMFLQILLGFSILVTAILKPEHRILNFNKDMSKEEYRIILQENEYCEALVKEEVKMMGFDELTPEESIRRLGIIVDRIDYDEDGYVTHEELKDWIIYSRRRYTRDSIYYEWKIYISDELQEKMLWTDYTAFYSDMDDYEKDKSSDGSLSKLQILKKNRRRWIAADLDGDDALDKIEFTSFTYPEDAEHMKDVIVLETIENIDKDGDGKISLTEYTSFIRYKGNEDKEVSEWVKNEIKQFSLHRDKDRDGFLNAEEVKTWVILPKPEDRAETESRFLIYKMDTDGDHELTKDEILEKGDIFVKSIATYYGDMLTRHNEF